MDTCTVCFMQIAEHGAICGMCQQSCHYQCSVATNEHTICGNCYTQMERRSHFHLLRAEQGRAQERYGVAQQGQDAARTAAHHAAVIGSLMGTVSAGAVGAAVGMGRHLFAAGRETWQSQRATVAATPFSRQPEGRRQLQPPGVENGAPVSQEQQELLRLRAQVAQLQHQAAMVEDQSFADAQSVGQAEPGTSSVGGLGDTTMTDAHQYGTDTFISGFSLPNGMPFDALASSPVVYGPSGNTSTHDGNLQAASSMPITSQEHRAEHSASSALPETTWEEYCEIRSRNMVNPITASSLPQLYQDYLRDNAKHQAVAPPTPLGFGGGTPRSFTMGLAQQACATAGSNPEGTPAAKNAIPGNTRNIAGEPPTLPKVSSSDESHLYRMVSTLKDDNVPKLIFKPHTRSKPLDLEDWLDALQLTLEGIHLIISSYFTRIRETAELTYLRYLQLSPLERVVARPRSVHVEGVYAFVERRLRVVLNNTIPEQVARTSRQAGQTSCVDLLFNTMIDVAPGTKVDGEYFTKELQAKKTVEPKHLKEELHRWKFNYRRLERMGYAVPDPTFQLAGTPTLVDVSTVTSIKGAMFNGVPSGGMPPTAQTMHIRENSL